MKDNRNLRDSNDNQKLSRNEIEEMKQKGVSRKVIRIVRLRICYTMVDVCCNSICVKNSVVSAFNNFSYKRKCV